VAAPEVQRLGRANLRAGGLVLEMLSDALSVSILRLLARGPLPSHELPARIGAASRTTRFNRLRGLEELGLIRRERRAGSPPISECILSPGGLALLPVARRFAVWLNRGPGGAGTQGKMADILAIKALAGGWNTLSLRWLAATPLTVTDLASLSSAEATYHDVRQARLALTEASLVRAVPRRGRGQPYELTEWARMAAGPLGAAARWEREFAAPAGRPLAPSDVEALLLLCLGLVESLPGELDGECLLLVEDLEGVRVCIERGAVTAVGLEGGGRCRNRVSGSAGAWLGALLDGYRGDLRMHGALRITTRLTTALHEACS
jgi:DNA-binding HxlR family transcriptional regulator